MRILHLVLIILFIGVLGAIGAAWFDLAPVPVLSDLAWKMKGYAPADTSEEAIERFGKALESRNYKAAQRYLDGEYQRKFRDDAKIATKLAEALDNFRSTAKVGGIDSDKVEDQIKVVEPFPKYFKSVKKVGGSDESKEVVYTVEEEWSSPRLPKYPRTVKVKKVEGAWRLDVSLDEIVAPHYPITRRDHLQIIDRNGQNLVNALNVVKNRMKTDATTKENVAADLKDELEKAMKKD